MPFMDRVKAPSKENATQRFHLRLIQLVKGGSITAKPQEKPRCDKGNEDEEREQETKTGFHDVFRRERIKTPIVSLV